MEIKSKENWNNGFSVKESLLTLNQREKNIYIIISHHDVTPPHVNFEDQSLLWLEKDHGARRTVTVE